MLGRPATVVLVPDAFTVAASERECGDATWRVDGEAAIAPVLGLPEGFGCDFFLSDDSDDDDGREAAAAAETRCGADATLAFSTLVLTFGDLLACLGAVPARSTDFRFPG